MFDNHALLHLESNVACTIVCRYYVFDFNFGSRSNGCHARYGIYAVDGCFGTMFCARSPDDILAAFSCIRGIVVYINIAARIQTVNNHLLVAGTIKTTILDITIDTIAAAPNMTLLGQNAAFFPFIAFIVLTLAVGLVSILPSIESLSACCTSIFVGRIFTSFFGSSKVVNDRTLYDGNGIWLLLFFFCNLLV